MNAMSSRCRRWSLLLGCSALFGLVLTSLDMSAQEKGKETDKDPKKAKTEPKKVVPKPPEVRDTVMPGPGGMEQILLINETLAKAWEDNKIVHSDRCTDFEFIRRASLDIIGRIAKVHEIERFMKDAPERRRSMLIDRLLGLEKGPDQQMYAEEFADNWASMWTNLLLTRQGTAGLYQEQMHSWLRDQFLMKDVPTDWSKVVSGLLTATGVTNDGDGRAATYILAHLGDPVPTDKETNGAFDMVPVTSRSTRLFLGLRTQCVQCHDHPFNEEWGQHHFWGINAFFRQVDAPRGRLAMMGKAKKGDKGAPQRELVDNARLNAKGIVPYERRTAVIQYTDATFLDGKKMKLASGSTRRQELAKFITNSSYFAKAYINRTWGHFFGKGLTKDNVDDFGEHNPPTFPEMFDTLAEKWAKDYKHDPKVLMRWICNSRAYGLSSVANATNDKPEDEVFMSRILLKAMTPEQLFESLMTATDAKVGQEKSSRIELRERWMRALIENFGDDEGNEGSYSGTVVQALLLMNGGDINDAIRDEKNGTVAAVIKRRSASATALKDAMYDLYLAALNRPPRADEYKRVLNEKMWTLFQVEEARKKTKAAPPTPQQFFTAYYQDLFWAILNSNEFFLNH